MSTTTIGKNTPGSEKLNGFIERVENVDGQIDDLRDDRKVIFAEAKADGFSARQMRRLLRVRKMKPQDHKEDEAEYATYEHAMGMATEPPLLAFMAKASTDTAVREQVIEAMKGFVPPNGQGDITVTMGGKPVRLARNKAGDVEIYDVVDKPLPNMKSTPQRKPKADVPEVDEAGAESLGKQYAKENRPVIDNPFPYGDTRRPRFDKGWRDQNGGDGMGPEDDDE